MVYTTVAPGAEMLEMISQRASSSRRLVFRTHTVVRPPTTVRGLLCTSTAVSAVAASVARGTAVSVTAGGWVFVATGCPGGRPGTMIGVLVGASVAVAVGRVTD